jgi:ribosome assembly protein 4
VNHLALSTDFVLRTAYHDHTGQVPPTDEEKVAKARERFEKAATIGGEVVERLVTASDDFTMYLWEPQKGTKPVARLLGHQKLVNYVSFSPDGRFIASASFDNHVKLWNGRDGKLVYPPIPQSLPWLHANHRPFSAQGLSTHFVDMWRRSINGKFSNRIL